jgi:hypothetical protein
MDLSMKNQSAYIKLHSLPEKLKAQALEFIDFLYQKNRDSNSNNHPKAGFLKGKIVIGKDFDEPLEDFKEYT